MSFQQHCALLALLLKADDAAAVDCLKQGAVQAQHFTHFIDHHQLHFCLFARLEREPPLRQFLPPSWAEWLGTFVQRRRARQDALVSELLRLASVLTEAGVEFILLKGPYLAERFFGGVEHRMFADLDIFVRRQHLAAVERVLRRNGYKRRSTILLHRALTTRFTHAFDFMKSTVPLDLHWLLSCQAAHYLDYDAIWKHKQLFVLRRQDFFVLSDEYEIVFHLISIFKDIERGAARLKSFVDLYFMLRAMDQHLDWESFLANRQREKIRRISLTVLALFLDLFNCREQFPAVAAVVAPGQGGITAVPTQLQQTLMQASPGALQNKVWAAGIYECSRFRVFLWWLVSLPFRLAVYHPGKYARCKHRVQQFMQRFWTHGPDRVTR
jgi:hypothetical protein